MIQVMMCMGVSVIDSLLRPMSRLRKNHLYHLWEGGVGKTMFIASFVTCLAQQGCTTCALIFDIGLQTLYIYLGVE